MDKYLEDLNKTALFSAIEQEDAKTLLYCVGARTMVYKKGEFIIEQESIISEFGIMLSGRGRVFMSDTSGRVFIITLLRKGSEIGVIIAAGQNLKSPVSVQAEEDCSVLMMSYDGLVSRCGNNCPAHDRMLRNYINIVANKWLAMHERVECLLRPTVREKIMVYLERVSREQNNKCITIPFDRYALSEYLSIERSALSRELSKMKSDGLIDYRKNVFHILPDA